VHLGKLAQMGTRLVEGTARSMADDCFDKFSGLLGGGEVVLEAGVAGPELPRVAPSSQSLMPWLAHGALLIAAALYAFLG
jgi:hypothetical protein